MILERFVLRDWKTNCYLIGDETSGKVAIVDPGAACPALDRCIEQNGYRVELVVLTHGHFDHILAAQQVAEHYNAPIAAHETEASLLFSLNAQFRSLEQNEFGSIPISVRLKDGDDISLGDIRLRVIHTPGHTPGGICLYGEGVLLSGDTLFQQSVGRTDFAFGNEQDLFDSVQTLYRLPDETVVYPGHGFSTTIGQEKQSNPVVRPL